MSTVASRHANWFAYFPEDYRWSAAVGIVLGSAVYGGADVGEVDRVGRRLASRVGDDDAWFREWVTEAERLRGWAERAEAAGRLLTASQVSLRACSYYQIGERFRTPKDEAALDAYRRAVECFHRFARLTDWPRIEPVEVPYQGTSLPAYFVRAQAATSEPRPCVVFFDGLDITKELCYLRGVTEMVRRGLHCLVVDGPGNGESIRFRGLDLRPEWELAGGAAMDYLERRPEVDAGRVGVLAISLGGYYAPRVAGLDQRYRACVAWGAQWDYHEVWRRRLERQFRTQLSVAPHHILWVLGVGSIDEAMARLEGFRLDGVAQRITCPFLLLHGEEDEQVPLGDAQALFDAVGSQDKTLRVFTAAEGGAQHCQHDYLTVASTEIADWLREKLGGQVRP